MKKNKKQKETKVKKDYSKILLTALLILVVIEVIMIPLLVYAKIIKILPVVFFLVIPSLLALAVLLLSRNSTIDYNRKLEKAKKIENQ